MIMKMVMMLMSMMMTMTMMMMIVIMMTIPSYWWHPNSVTVHGYSVSQSINLIHPSIMQSTFILCFNVVYYKTNFLGNKDWTLIKKQSL